MKPVPTGSAVAPTTPAAATPHAAAPAATPNSDKAPAKEKPLGINDITYDLSITLDVTEQDRLLKSFDSHVERLAESRDEMKQESKRMAILLAGLEQRVKRGIEARIYASTFTVSDLYKQVTGNKPPGHVYNLKCAFVSFVLSGMLPESGFLANRNNCLALGQKIVDACIEASPETGLQHEAVSRAAEELTNRTDEEAKNLRAILASVKPVAPMTEEQALENLAPILAVMTCGIALKMFDAIAASGNLPPCLVTIPDLVKTMPETAQKEAYIALARSIEKTDVAIGDKVDEWSMEASGVIPIRVTHGETAPAETPAAAATETAETPAEAIAA